MKEKKKRSAAKTDLSAPFTEGFLDNPEGSLEMVNKFGTYEIQPTADTANYFPAIAQGLPTQPTARNKRKDNIKSKKHDNGKMWE